jgi:hypothetical protein
MRALAALVALGLATSAMAADDKAVPPKPDKKICRRIEVIASIIPQHVCLTKAEWEQFDAENAEKNKNFFARRGDAHGMLSGGPQ